MSEHSNNLSAREIEILQLVAKGLTNREIAYQLTISPNTVKVHLSNIFDKISVASRTEATLYGIEHGYVDMPGKDEEPETTEAPPQQDLLQKYAWVIIPLILLIITLTTITVINLVTPKPTTPLPYTQTADRWQKLAPMPAGRVGMAAVVYSGDIYAIAGQGADGPSGSVFLYIPETDSWTQLTNKPTPVADVQGVLISEKIYIPGGIAGDGSPTSILEIYDPRQDEWSNGAPLPQPISAYALAGFEGQVYLFGGWDGEETLDVVYVYEPQTNTWHEGTSLETARQKAGVVASADKLIVAGGKNSEGALSDVVSYYPARDVNGEDPWESFNDLPVGRFDFGITTVSDAIHIIGGDVDKTNINEPIGRVFIDGTWNPLEIELGEKPHALRLLSIGSLLYSINPTADLTSAELMSYKAYFYEIFLPIIQ